MKVHLLTALLLVSPLIFGQPHESPHVCPDANRIRTGGLNFVDYNCSDGTYSVGQRNNYGTSEPWAFLIQHIPAAQEAEAIKKGELALQSISGSPQPHFEPNYGWACIYKVPEPGYFAIAFVFEG